MSQNANAEWMDEIAMWRVDEYAKGYWMNDGWMDGWMNGEMDRWKMDVLMFIRGMEKLIFQNEWIWHDI